MKQNDSSTSLQKSHSVWSNTKLTALCVVAVIASSCVWASLGLKEVLDSVIFYIALGVSVVVTVLCLLAFNKFKR